MIAWKKIYFVLIVTIGLVIVYGHKGFDDTILYKINWEELEDNGKPHEKLLINSAQKEEYECFIPQVSESHESQNDVDYEFTPYELILPLHISSICSYRVENYWNYQLCFGNYIRQFHEERDGKNVKVQEYFLGKWNAEQNTEAYQAKLKQNNEKLNYKKIDGVNLPYFEVEMANGTICDINNEERKTKVLYICYPNGKNDIYSLKETSTCNYEIIVLTNLLCAHPRFKLHEEVNINCSALNKSPKKPRALLAMEVDNMKSYFQKVVEFKNVMKAGIFKENGLRMDMIQNQMKPKPIEDKEVEDKQLQNFKNKLNTLSDAKSLFMQGKKCLTGGKGWWKYEFCYQVSVRQFHIDEKGVETSILLGNFNIEKHLEWIKKRPLKKGKNQINQLYTDGAFCEETGKPRQVEVQMKCDESSISPSKISLYLLEPQVCNYILGVESPIICEFFKSWDGDEEKNLV